MTDLFNRCIAVILKNEGGFQADPNDPGNWVGTELRGTKYGISAKAFPDLDIKNLTEEQAKEIYYDNYWLPLKLEGLVDENAALQIFDMGVNSGLYRAVRIAQYCAKAHEDGIMGKASIAAINNSPCFVERYKTARVKFYSSLTGANKYLKGWIRRVLESKLI